jgi:hypothetical protein
MTGKHSIFGSAKGAADPRYLVGLPSNGEHPTTRWKPRSLMPQRLPCLIAHDNTGASVSWGAPRRRFAGKPAARGEIINESAHFHFLLFFRARHAVCSVSGLPIRHRSARGSENASRRDQEDI